MIDDLLWESKMPILSCLSFCISAFRTVACQRVLAYYTFFIIEVGGGIYRHHCDVECVFPTLTSLRNLLSQLIAALCETKWVQFQGNQFASWYSIADTSWEESFLHLAHSFGWENVRAGTYRVTYFQSKVHKHTNCEKNRSDFDGLCSTGSVVVWAVDLER